MFSFYNRNQSICLHLKPGEQTDAIITYFNNDFSELAKCIRLKDGKIYITKTKSKSKNGSVPHRTDRYTSPKIIVSNRQEFNDNRISINTFGDKKDFINHKRDLSFSQVLIDNLN